jgi:hypothetical protein
MAGERPSAPFIGNTVEALLAVGWYALAIAGVLLGALVSPALYALLLVGVPADWVLLRRRVAKRLQIRPEDRKMLRLWTSSRGLWMGLRYFAGRG